MHSEVSHQVVLVQEDLKLNRYSDKQCTAYDKDFVLLLQQ